MNLKTTVFRGGITLLAAICLFLARAQAVAVGDLAIHGSLSLTAASSPEYNYLGSTKGGLDLNIVEATVNTGYQWGNGLSASAQVFGYRLEGYDAVMIDFANVAYKASDAFGIRAGYIKQPGGLYSEVLDLDQVRPFAFLPLGTYSKIYRPMSSNFIGISTYGRFVVDKGNSIEYTLFFGTRDSAKGNTPLIKFQSNSGFSRMDKVAFGNVYGGQLVWNTAIEGLKFQFCYFDQQDINIDGSVYNATDAAMQPDDSRVLPYYIGVPTWNGYFADSPVHYKGSYKQWFLGAEYTKGDWTFAAEYTPTDTTADVSTLIPSTIVPRSNTNKGDSYYGMITWQALPKLSFGLYYNEAYTNRHDRSGALLNFVPRHRAYTKDLAFATSYSLTKDWLVKAEVHSIKGTSQLRSNGGLNGEVSQWPEKWGYYVIKTTFTF
jgi:hypothetical protein